MFKYIYIKFFCLFFIQAVNLAAIDVAILHRLIKPKSTGSEGLLKTFRHNKTYKDLKIKIIDQISEENLKGIDVVIISHAYDYNNKNILRKFVNSGGGVLLTHDAAGSGRTSSTNSASGSFPELVYIPKGYVAAGINVRKMKIINRQHPITKDQKQFYRTQFSDYLPLFPVKDHAVLVESAPVKNNNVKNKFPGTQRRWDKYNGGHAVMIADQFGKGRVILYGGLPGLNTQNNAEKLLKDEAKLMASCIKWLAGKGNLSAAKNTSNKTKYRIQKEKQLPKLSKGCIKVLNDKVIPFSSKPNQYIRLNFNKNISLNKSVVVKFYCNKELGKPAALVINKTEYPLLLQEENGQLSASFVMIPTKKEYKALVKYNTNVKGVSVKIRKGADFAEIMLPHAKIIVGSENGSPCISFLQIYDWDWHHTWEGLERNCLSAPLFRLSPKLWPYWRKPPSIFHEKGHPIPKFVKIAQSFKNPLKIKLKVGEGKITVYSSGQIILEKFSSAGRIATWGFDYYKSKKSKFYENLAFDMPEIKNCSWMVKVGRYALGGDFEIVPQLGLTGMSPGVIRKIRNEGKYLVATCDLNNMQSYNAPPKEITAQTKKIAPFPFINKSIPVILPTHRLLSKKLLKKHHKNDMFNNLPTPIEIYKDLLPANLIVDSWEFDNKAILLHESSNSSPKKILADKSLKKALNIVDQHCEDIKVYRRLYVSFNKKTPIIGDFHAKLYGKSADGKIVLVVPVQIRRRVTIPTGIFTYSPRWTERTEIKEIHWPKMIRDIAMTGMDYVIHEATGQKSTESPDKVFSRMKRYGLRWFLGLNGIGREYLKLNKIKKLKRSSVVPFIAVKKLDDKMVKIIKKYRNDPAIIAWYLGDELPGGDPVSFDKLTLGYALANHLYDIAAKELPPDAIKVHLITTWFTKIASWKKYLKTDVWSWDRYRSSWKELEKSTRIIKKKVNTPATKPMWISIRSCGPGWWDCVDLWADIRRQTIVSFLEDCASINYFAYSGWRNSNRHMERYGWYTVLPGRKGPTGTPRRQILDYAMEDIHLLSSVKYLLDNYLHTNKKIYQKKYNQAKKFGHEGKYYQMRLMLIEIIKKLTMKI